MIELRIIFYGLIAFVPGAYEDGSMAAVFVDAEKVETFSDGERFPAHIAHGWVLEGSCSGCQGDGFEMKTGSVMSIAEVDDAPPVPTTGRRWLSNGAARMYPTLPGHLRDFSWVPVMEYLDNQAGEFYGPCLGDPSPCPVQSVFRIGRGLVQPCHFVHELFEDTNCRCEKCEDEKFQCEECEDKCRDEQLNKLLIFRFHPWGYPASTGDHHQAVADAVLFETTIESSKISLVSGGSQSALEVTPDNNGRVTLIVANFRTNKVCLEEFTGQKVDRSDQPAIDRHFEAYYSFTSIGFPPDQMDIPRSTQRIVFGSDPEEFGINALAFEELSPNGNNLQACESEIEDLTHLLERDFPSPERCQQVSPHSMQVCSPSQFSFLADPFPIPRTSGRGTVAPDSPTTLRVIPQRPPARQRGLASTQNRQPPI